MNPLPLKLSLVLLFSLSLLSYEKPNKSKISVANRPIANYYKTKEKATDALTFCMENDYNTDFCILIDMSLHSGIKRFYIWDFATATIQNSFLVSHGCGDENWSSDSTKDNPQFSNTKNSHLSSLGKYEIGKRGYSNWGINIKYLMHGLESTNDNALSRYIVFHSWQDVGDNETYPKGTPEGWGCPAVSNKSMRILDPILSKSSKPILMWIYQ